MKSKISNIPELCDNRRTLRKNQTPQEIILWSRLRGEQLGYKFRRQHSFGNFIADFYCSSKRLVIEIDGSQHLDNEKYDSERTKFFESRGLQVLRFWNNEINANISGVIGKIMEVLEENSTPLPRGLGISPLKRGEGNEEGKSEN